MNAIIHFEDKVSCSPSKREGESSQDVCERLDHLPLLLACHDHLHVLYHAQFGQLRIDIQSSVTPFHAVQRIMRIWTKPASRVAGEIVRCGMGNCLLHVIGASSSIRTLLHMSMSQSARNCSIAMNPH